MRMIIGLGLLCFFSQILNGELYFKDISQDEQQRIELMILTKSDHHSRRQPLPYDWSKLDQALDPDRSPHYSVFKAYANPILDPEDYGVGFYILDEKSHLVAFYVYKSYPEPLHGRGLEAMVEHILKSEPRFTLSLYPWNRWLKGFFEKNRIDVDFHEF
jgi:hypothetical protein